MKHAVQLQQAGLNFARCDIHAFDLDHIVEPAFKEKMAVALYHQIPGSIPAVCGKHRNGVALVQTKHQGVAPHP